ncbi:hypothetical protein L518_0966 [Bordetella bronchiseptica MBORD675]|nr:hypothetical protein L507_1237 [Bordetella bronchiseptica CA90 BB02]KDC18291.1 hypothetical protein L542_1288 [Bordetella bronchiseptica F-1]KDC24860.1 hypothetical protein L504_1315 [Bordetella bronchiseptica F2]KDC26786.1 hypothetical protein L505_1320 [Bordetella bronchiseptica F4563]KDC94542.1 hypothetical protein L518_0966 [Bordetella bronchiseptica MBORD675]KDD11319.1 hypothetical protein L522_1316 [Bordetella bronchiseptica MBORD707]
MPVPAGTGTPSPGGDRHPFTPRGQAQRLQPRAARTAVSKGIGPGRDAPGGHTTVRIWTSPVTLVTGWISIIGRQARARRPARVSTMPRPAAVGVRR